MKDKIEETAPSRLIEFYAGWVGAIFPFVVFIIGVVIVALSGAPDERGFWPILILALSCGLLLSKDKKVFSETVIDGMSERIVMIMITAWILASIIGVLMTQTGFVEALIWLSAQMNMSGSGFVIASFIICCTVSLSTGSSFATILICSPLLYPAGGLLEAHLPTLAGAIIGGATFGDFIAPISDTTIASALSQRAPIGPTVRSRIKYIIPPFLLAGMCYFFFAHFSEVANLPGQDALTGSPRGLPMMIVPVLIIGLFLKGKHLIHGLLMGLILGVILGMSLGLMPLEKLFSLDLDNFVARSFIIDGINRAVGISIFTILLMGMVATLKASGLIDRLVLYASKRIHTKKQAEGWISGSVAAAVLLTTHSIVAILTVADFSNKTGHKMALGPIRRANILSLVVCAFPFLLPYFIPVILMSSMTSTGKDLGIPSVSPLEVGMHNFIAWGFLLMAILVIISGYGQVKDSKLDELK